MNDKIQIRILNALLDKYERSAFFREKKLPTRRIAVVFYDGGKSDFPYYDIEQGELRVSINRAVAYLKEKNLLSFDWMKGDYGHIIAKVWLNIDNLPAAYKAAGREPKGDVVDEVCREISGILGGIKSNWAREFLQDALNDITKKRDLTSAVPADKDERARLLSAISAIDGLNGAECMERVFSLRVFGGTKVFEQSVRARLLSILRKYLDNDDSAADEDILKQIGIVKYPEQFEFCGNISVLFDSIPVNFSPMPCGGAIYSSDLSAGRIQIDPFVESIITIENRANYIDYIRKTKTEKELVIYHGGQCSPRKRAFLQAVAAALPGSCKWRHWSDIDYGGFVMLLRLRREIIPGALPYRMNSGELANYKNLAAPIKAQYAEKLKTLKAHPELEDCHGCIDYMLENMIRLEQEAMLA